MNSKYAIDDAVLVKLLKNDSSKLIYQAILKKYKKAFVPFFKEKEKMSNDFVNILFGKSFKLLIDEISQKEFETPLKKTLYERLLKMGYNELDKVPPKNQMKHPYLAGELLIQLILKGYHPCIDQLFEQYQNPVVRLLDIRYGHSFNLNPQEIYGEAIMILKSNIEKGKLKTKLKSRLFTYFYLIARNKYLELANQMKGLAFYPDTINLEHEMKREEDEPHFMSYIEECHPKLLPMLENSKEGAFTSLLTTFHKDERELLRLRFEEGLKFSEIGKRLQLKEATCRKRLHDCLKKWKRKFFDEKEMGSLIPLDSGSPIRSIRPRLFSEKQWRV